MHPPASSCRELRFLPAMFSFSGSTTTTNLPQFDFAPPTSSASVQTTSICNNWETRCLRKQRSREYDEGCSAKKRRLMFETEVETPKNKSSSSSSLHHDWQPAANSPQPGNPQRQPLPLTSSAPPPTDTEHSSMEIEAAQRRLQEIEDRITLEDDDEDLQVEATPRRPVLVMSDSLREGLQHGLADILPHTVAQSVSHSCMELVLWRPPDDPFCRRLKGSIQKQRRQQGGSQPPAAPHPPTLTTPHPPTLTTPSPGEEDMEM